MAKSKQITFNVFRYQILPISQDFQLQFEPPISSLEELRSRKNDFFAEALMAIEKYEFSRTELIHIIVATEGSLFALKLGANRGITRTTRDFTDEELENWPSILIIFNNDPEIQKVAIQVDYKVFYRTTTAARVLEDNLNRFLARFQLHVRFMPTFGKNYFWEIVDRYPRRIVQAEFKMISPNLSQISRNLNFDLEALHKSTNTQETTLELKSDKESSLVFSHEDDFINRIVNYASEGGGNITLKIQGLRKSIKTDESITEISADEMQLKGLSQKEFLDLFNGLLQND